ncbi:Outer membrane protein assembly factor BamA [Algoriphagus aquimarinus]|uniref:Outer membrane protein assembly factor BamA n=2 Tax=Algoriphagus aquimarinus TaxID=237018 RepID=A0A1I1A0E4_9BACT|nr:Outer membrane protein assembly factor BamA [Algoriphagus aquimarinus]|tara:strand:- start:26658 stop:29033 length:2376 start_codon:yes stop_codon:yes gene_type:complete
MQACSLSKNLPEGEYVLNSNTLEGVEKANHAQIEGLYFQEPNTKIPLTNSSLGVSIYRIGRFFYDSAQVNGKLKSKNLELQLVKERLDEASDDRKLLKRRDKLQSKIQDLEKLQEYGNFLMRTGNPVAVLDSSQIKKTVIEIDNYLYNKGFLDSDVSFEVETKKKKANVIYIIEEKEPYLLDSIYTNSANEGILSLVNGNKDESFIKKGDSYDQSNFTKERERLENLFKNNGYFMFTKSFIDYNLYYDTTSKRINVEQRILKPSFSEKHEIYSIDSITFKVSPPNDEFVDEKVLRNYRDIDFTFYRDRFSSKLLSSRILFDEGEPYNRLNIVETQKQLSNLDLFRYINISFDTVGTSLTAKILTQPNQKYQLTNQLGLSITEQLPGPFFSTVLRNRNFFRAGEILEFNARVGYEGVASATDQGVYQSKEFGASASVIFPRFLIPFYGKSLQKYGRYNPNTRTQLGYNFTNRPEYTRSGLNGLLAYTWATRNKRQQYTLNLADINYIRTPNITPEFLAVLTDLQDQGNNLIWSFLPSLVSSVSAQSIINFNEYGDFSSSKASLLRLFVESGGTTLNLFNVKDITETTTYANFQWLKLQADFRRYEPITPKQTIAYRVNFGVAQPYGISAGILPYEKYFFAGGGTSIRAWQARRLGPGSYTPPIGDKGRYDYSFEQPAEMIFETMLEYRRALFGYFDMAAFIDAGNAWVIGIDNSRPGADFRFDRFYKEIAIGAGLGLRMDFNFLVVRLDLATKAVDPSMPEGQRWVLDNISFRNLFGVKGQTVLNFGIGYPF